MRQRERDHIHPLIHLQPEIQHQSLSSSLNHCVLPYLFVQSYSILMHRLCVQVCVCAYVAGIQEAVAKEAGKVCSFLVLLPVYFSLYEPSSAGWGQRVSLSTQSTGAVGTSKLLVTTGSGIQVNTQSQTNIHKCTHKTVPVAETRGIDRWGVYLLERPLPVDRTSSQRPVFVYVCDACGCLCLICSQRQSVQAVCVSRQKTNTQKKRTAYVQMDMHSFDFGVTAISTDAAHGCSLILMDDNCGFSNTF